MAKNNTSLDWPLTFRALTRLEGSQLEWPEKKKRDKDTVYRTQSWKTNPTHQIDSRGSDPKLRWIFTFYISFCRHILLHFVRPFFGYAHLKTTP